MSEPTLLPSPFYRVTSRALILDNQQRLLVVQDDEGGWQLPGGGLEHGETFIECLQREVREELGVGVVTVGSPLLIYPAPSDRGHVILRIAAHVTIDSWQCTPGDNMVAYKTVSRDEFAAMELLAAEGQIQAFADQIWSTAIQS